MSPGITRAGEESPYPGRVPEVMTDVLAVLPSFPYDAAHHEPGSVAAAGRCSWHGWDGRDVETCGVDAVVSFQDATARWHSGCAVALQELVRRGVVAPLD